MNYGEIKKAAQSYTDRYDAELVTALPAFSRVVESKINTALKTGEQSVRAQIYLSDGEEFYGLPSDWGGFRDVELVKKGSANLGAINAKSGFGGKTLRYASPEYMNQLERRQDGGHGSFYTVIADQIQVAPPAVGDVLECVYYQLVPALKEDADENWLSEKHPDVYIYGLASEIASFAKDEASFMAYDARFKESLSNIIKDDQVTRWSGPSLRTEVDGLIV